MKKFQKIDLSTDESISSFIPYWDWTRNSSIPELARDGEWAHGPMKFGAHFGLRNSTVSVRGRNYQDNFNETFTSKLGKLTETAYSSTCFEEFQFLIQYPHNIVHCNI